MKLSEKGIKITKTCNLYLCYMTLGMCLAAPGPCLLDLQKLVNTDINSIGLIYTARSTGFLLGTVLGGVVLDLIKPKQALINIFNLIMAVTFLAIPWSRSIGMLTGLMTVNGAFMGAMEVGCNVVCLMLWGSDSAPFYQALHFTFGVGGLIAPLIAAPFLDNNEDTLIGRGNFTAADNFTTEFEYGNNNITDETLPNIFYPFSIIGAYGVLVAMTFLIVCFMKPIEESKTEVKNKRDKEKPSLKFLASVILLNFLLLFLEMGTEIGFPQMVTSYAVKGPLHLTPSVGSYITSSFWAAFTAYLFISVFLAIKFDNFSLIVSDLIIMSLGAAVLLLFKSYEWSLWLSSILIGAGIASFFPAAVGWLDTYIDVTNKIASVFFAGAAFGEMVVPFTITYFIDTVPEVLIYVVPASCILSILCVFVLYMILRKRPKKVTEEAVKEQDPNCSVAHISQ